MLQCEDLTKTYRTPNGEVKALYRVSLRIDKGQFVAVCGPSGSGKTTLLMTIAAMLRPSAGTVQFEEEDIYGMAGSERAAFRAKNIGFVFQMFHLVPYLNVLENVLLAGGASQGPQTGPIEPGRKTAGRNGQSSAESAEADSCRRTDG